MTFPLSPGSRDVTSPDAALLDRVAAGDEEALGMLMARHAPSLMRYASHFLGSADDADDVLQEVFLRAERAIRGGQRPEQLAAWLYRITVNRCRTARRRWWFLRRSPAPESVLAAQEASGGPDGWIWREEIAAALATLTPSLREAFLLKHVEGFSYEEMAEATGASQPALKMRVSRACEQLRGRLAEVVR